MLIRYECPDDCALHMLNVNMLQAVRVMEHPEQEGVWVFIADFPNEMQAHLCEFGNRGEAATVSEAFQLALISGMAVFDLRIIRDYLQTAVARGVANNLELKYIVRAATQMTYDAYQEFVGHSMPVTPPPPPNPEEN